VILRKWVDIKNDIPIRNNGMVGVTVIECSQLKGVKPKMRGQILRSGVYWQGELKQKDV
jgi:hypothetical protein